MSSSTNQLIINANNLENLAQSVQNLHALNSKVDEVVKVVRELSGKLKKEKIAAADVSTNLQELHTAVTDR